MEKKIRLSTTIFIALVCTIMASLITYFALNNIMIYNGKLIQKHQTMINKLIGVDEKLRKNFIGKIDDEKLIDGILSGYMYSVDDKYSAYYDKKTYREINQDMNGEYEGIGLKVDFNKEKNGLKITNIMKGSPASKTDLLIGDIIVKVKDEKVSDLGYDASVNKLLGKVGTPAEFSILKDDKEKQYSIIREKFDIVTVEPAIMLNGNKAFIRITEFDNKTPDNLRKEVDTAIIKGATGIVFDLRNNPGGSLDAVVKCLDYLLPKGTIVTLQYKEGLVDEKGKKVEPVVYTSDENEIKIPMIVLINENTASAGELFTAALRDYEKAKLVGEKTYGKGVGQETFDLGDETAVKFTTFTYKPPKGNNYDGVGIMPDYEVVMPPELKGKFYLLKPEEDNQLQKALELLK